jgi:sugar phosphate isomerase/epimerase
MNFGAVIAHQGQASPVRHRAWAALGCASLAYAFRHSLAGVDLDRLSKEATEVSADTQTMISCLGLYGNTLAPGSVGEEVRLGLRRLIEKAATFGTDLVSCFAGRVDGESVPASRPRFIEVFEPLVRYAEDHGVRLAIENCRQGGTWLSGSHNFAFHPRAWEMIFESLPSPALGLEWDPAHLIAQQLDPLPILETWISRIFHIHAKDARPHLDVLRTQGIHGPDPAYFHVNPGNGLTNWTAVVAFLRKKQYQGMIDLELGYDPTYRDERLEEGLVFSLQHLRQCFSESGPNVPN